MIPKEDRKEFVDKIRPHLGGIWKEVDNGRLSITYTGHTRPPFWSLVIDEFGWMYTSDIDLLDHSVILEVSGSVLLTGFGLGLGVIYCHLNENIKSVSIVEFDQDVIDIVVPMVLPTLRSDLEVNIIRHNADTWIPDKEYDLIYLDHHKETVPLEVINVYKSYASQLVNWGDEVKKYNGHD